MYESPIKINFDDGLVPKIIREINEQHEHRIMAVVNETIEVDRDELIKALNYDREQYKKGYEDGYKAAKALNFKPTYAEWRKTDDRWGLGAWLCSNCEEYFVKDTNFCPFCGADMRRHIRREE